MAAWKSQNVVNNNILCRSFFQNGRKWRTLAGHTRPITCMCLLDGATGCGRTLLTGALDKRCSAHCYPRVWSQYLSTCMVPIGNLVGGSNCNHHVMCDLSCYSPV